MMKIKNVLIIKTYRKRPHILMIMIELLQKFKNTEKLIQYFQKKSKFYNKKINDYKI